MLVAEFSAQGFEIGIERGGLSHDEAGHEAKQGIIDFAIFSDGESAGVAGRNDFVVPCSSKRQFGVCDLRD